MSIDKPEVDFPGGPPPADLEITDIWEGDGAEARAGDTVQVHYVGVAYSTGEEFDASWSRGIPLEFELGAGRVIAGWDEGVQGMKVGGRRQLVIPPDLAYGDRGAGSVIAPGETLIFVCDLVSVLPTCDVGNIAPGCASSRSADDQGPTARSSERPAWSRGHWAIGRPPGHAGTGGQAGGPSLVRVMEHARQPGRGDPSHGSWRPYTVKSA